MLLDAVQENLRRAVSAEQGIKVANVIIEAARKTIVDRDDQIDRLQLRLKSAK